jgi:hypothetical protein
MSTDMDDLADDFEYRVETVELAVAPTDMPNEEWHSYVIVRGKTRIEGLKCGSHFEVMQHAEAAAEGFNQRFSKGYTSYVSSKKKK